MKTADLLFWLGLLLITGGVSLGYSPYIAAIITGSIIATIGFIGAIRRD